MDVFPLGQLYQKKAKLLQRQNQEYGQFCGEHDLKPLQDRVKIAGWGRKQAASATAAARKGFENPTEYAKMEPLEVKGGEDVHFVGKINRDIYSVVASDIKTDEVIMTDERIDHVKNSHPEDFERYSGYIKQMIENPQYILEDKVPYTAVILQEFEEHGEHFRLILKMAMPEDEDFKKNSIITFLKISEKKFKKYLRNKNILYKRE